MLKTAKMDQKKRFLLAIGGDGKTCIPPKVGWPSHSCHKYTSPGWILLLLGRNLSKVE